MTWLIFLYMTIGFLFLLFIIYLLYRYYLAKPIQPKRFPSDSYMKNMGLRCPDYWTYQNGTCVNQFNIPVANPKFCYDDPKNKTKKFQPITRWPVNSNEVDDVLKDRCQWVRNCGPNNKLPASWVGIDEEHC